MVHLWRGYHNLKLIEILKSAWQNEDLVILISPTIKSFSFLRLFDPNQIVFHGEWPDLPSLQSNSIQLDSLDLARLKKARLGVFTSGTNSGNPRLIFYSKENIITSLQSIRGLFQTHRIKKIFSYPQPNHVFGLVLGYMHAILNNLSVHFSQGPYSKKTHDDWLSLVDENTLTLGTPTHFLDLIHKVKAEGLTPKKSYSAIIGGARSTVELWNQLRDVLNIECPSIGYGASEASPGLTHLPPGMPPQEDGDVGFALDKVKMKSQADGVTFSGPNLCLALFENEQLNYANEIVLSDQLIENPGPEKTRYTFLGRTDLLINRGGAKYSLEVIEGKLSSYFGCKCLAISFYEPRLGEDIGILIQSEIKSDLQEQVRNFLVKELGLKLSLENILACEIPLSANGKFDRKEALTQLLKKRVWSFPITIEHLRPFLPHRPPAIWIDSMLDVKFNYGKARVIINETANYFGPFGVRESACIEWIAQAYGYVVALSDILDIKHSEKVSKAFIVEVKDAQFHFRNPQINLVKDDEITIEVNCTHDFGLVKVVQGKVFYQERLLANLNMKLYSGN